MTKPSGCAGCVLEHKGKGFCPDERQPHAEYVIVGEAPGTTEIGAGKPFQGRAGFVLKQWIMRGVPQLQLAAERGNVSYMNVLKCLPPETQGRPYPRGAEKDAAEAQCKQYMDLGDAKTIILAGESPQRFFFRDELAAEDADDKKVGHDLKGVMGRVGRTYARDGRTWVFTAHPAYILRQPALIQHGQESMKIGMGVDAVMIPEYVEWDSAIQELA